MNKCQICQDTNKYVLEILHGDEVRYMCSVQWNEMISDQFVYEPALAERYYVLPEGCAQHPADINDSISNIKDMLKDFQEVIGYPKDMTNECDTCGREFPTSEHPAGSYQTPYGNWFCSHDCGDKYPL